MVQVLDGECGLGGLWLLGVLVVAEDHVPELGSVADEALETGSAHWV